MLKKIIFRLAMAIGAFILLLILNLVAFNLMAPRVTEGTPIPDDREGNTALLVIDVQEGTTGNTSTNASFIRQSSDFIKHLNLAIERAREKGWDIIYVNTEVANPLLNLLNSSMARGSLGVQLDSRLKVSTDLLITKRRNDSFRNTDLDQLLEEKGIDHLVFAGLDAANCVEATFMAARNRNYQLSVLSDGIISDPDSVVISQLELFKSLGASIIPVADL